MSHCTHINPVTINSNRENIQCFVRLTNEFQFQSNNKSKNDLSLWKKGNISLFVWLFLLLLDFLCCLMLPSSICVRRCFQKSVKFINLSHSINGKHRITSVALTTLLHARVFCLCMNEGILCDGFQVATEKGQVIAWNNQRHFELVHFNSYNKHTKISKIKKNSRSREPKIWAQLNRLCCV